MIEQRGYPIADLMAHIRVKGGRVNYIMDVEDIRQTGLFVATEKIKQMPWFRVNQLLEMDLFASEELDNLRVNGRIVRIVKEGNPENQGFGVAFVSVDDQTRDALMGLIESAVARSIQPPPLPLQAG